MWDHVINALVTAGVPVALVAGAFALWRIAIDHRRVLEQQKERYRYDLSLEIYADISDRTREALNALSLAASTASTLASNFNSLEKQLCLSKQIPENLADKTPLQLALEHTLKKQKEAEKFVNLKYAAGEAVGAVNFTLRKYQVALPKSKEMEPTIREQWEACYVPSDELNNWAVNSFGETAAEKYRDITSPENPGNSYVTASMEVSITLEILLLKAQKELVGELFQNVIIGRKT